MLINSIKGDWRNCRVLLDSGSESTVISQGLAKKLNLRRSRTSFIVRGISEEELLAKGIVEINLKSRFSDAEIITAKALVLTDLPNNIPSSTRHLNDDDYNFIEQFKETAADINFNQSQPIDVILGAEYVFNILSGCKRSNNNLTAHSTEFGWIFTGKSKPSELSITKSFQLVCKLDETLRRFWELEEINSCSPYSNDESECERIFQETTTRDKHGRFIVQIPLKCTREKLGNSYKQAIQRFYNLEKKLAKNDALKKAYSDVMNEYVQMGHLVELKRSELTINQESTYYLPHHAVMKTESSTTKVRVVFDGSSKTSTGISLNDTMLVGPTIQPTLWSNLIRFRFSKVAFTADIEKMYRQVRMVEPHQHLQRVLWREDSSKPILQYKLTTVTFGLASSSFLAIQALQQLGHESSNSIVQRTILEDFYVDDLLSGADSEVDALTRKEELIRTLKSGGFELRKWKSNSPVIGDNSHDEKIIRDDGDGVKVLGLNWNPAHDIFHFKICEFENHTPTKRIVLSEFSRVFDPLGWLSPSIVLMKIIFQKLWSLNLSWDEPLPSDVAREYMLLRNQLKQLEAIQIPRYLGNSHRVQYHGFCDASKKAYAAVIYIRVESEDEVITRIVTAKTKVAPLKIISNTRMELMGAFLLTKLYIEFKKLFDEPIRFYAWTDSTQVLAYLSDYPGRWKTFVGNRTAMILENLPRDRWNYINTKHNPADPASRGILPKQLADTEVWWQGPNWLKLNEELWPIQPVPEDASAEVELEKVTSIHKLVTANLDSTRWWMEKLLCENSSFNKVIRLMAYMLRYRNNLIHRHHKRSGFLTSAELKAATHEVMKYVQKVAFGNELDILSRRGKLSKRCNLTSLTPFLDENGLLRVGGRLHNYSAHYNKKHPIIVPKGHVIGELIAREEHLNNLHCGPSLTFHLTRQKYWIIGGRNLVRKLVKNCIICSRYNAKTTTQLMGDLPAVRVNPARPFDNCGVDYAGPIEIATKKGRGAKLIKGYIAVFICMVTKAVHIEAVSDLTTDAFLAAFHRFSSRRGFPSNVYSDRGTNFVGAKRKIDEIAELVESSPFNNKIKGYLANMKIEWHFNPPNTPHYGGLWERAVQSIKGLMYKTTYNVHLTFEEMTTLLIKIEAILNSRPLCSMNMSDDTDCEVLTPAHFLIGATLYSVPELEVNENTPINRLNRYEIIQQRTQSFWRTFHTQYIHELQQRDKWQNKSANLKIGDIVIVKTII